GAGHPRADAAAGRGDGPGGGLHPLPAAGRRPPGRRVLRGPALAAPTLGPALTVLAAASPRQVGAGAPGRRRDWVAPGGAVAGQVDDVAGAQPLVGPDVVGRHEVRPAGQRGVPAGGVATPGLPGVRVRPGPHEEALLDQGPDAVAV